jgi:hypothetical protein
MRFMIYELRPNRPVTENKMATPKELVLAVAKNTGVPINSVVQHDRNLSLAGLRTVAGRGRAAAKMTYQDAANLIIAVAASRNVKDSAATVSEYSALVADRQTISNVRGKTFGDALAWMIASMPAARNEYHDPAIAWVTVSLFGPRPHATIELGERGEITTTISYRDMGGHIRTFHDLVFVSKFTQVTLGLVGEALTSR